MMRARFFRHPSQVLAGCLLLALSGCASKALDQQLAASQDAVNQAKMAGADQTAPSDFQVAADKLDRASAEKKRNKKDAMRLAEEAQVDANLARARTDSAQARFAAAELTKSNQILRDEHRARENQSR